MQKLHKILIIAAGIAYLTIIIMIGSKIPLFRPKRPPMIVNYQPSSFVARGDTNFFYSIGDELKYSDQIDPNAPTIFNGNIQHLFVSPDNKKAAIITDNELIILSSDGRFKRQVTPVESGCDYSDNKKIGRGFFRSDNYQWSSNSESIYLIRNVFMYFIDRKNCYSKKSELWRYDLRTGQLTMVITPFKTYDYFTTVDNKIFFSVSDDIGDLHLRSFDGVQQRDIPRSNSREFTNKQLTDLGIKSPFYTFQSFMDLHNILKNKGVKFRINKNKGEKELVINEKVYLTQVQGDYFIKNLFLTSIDLHDSTFLPGDRYFLLDRVGSGNFSGELLFDVSSGKYMPLPKDTKVYPLINTNTYKNFRVTNSGITIN